MRDSAIDVLEVNAPDGSGLLGLGVLLHELSDLLRGVDKVEADLAGLLEEAALGVLAQLAVLRVTPGPESALDVDHGGELCAAGHLLGGRALVEDALGLADLLVLGASAALAGLVVAAGVDGSLIWKAK